MTAIDGNVSVANIQSPVAVVQVAEASDGTWEFLSPFDGLSQSIAGRPGYIQIGDSIIANGNNPLAPTLTATVGETSMTVAAAGHGQWVGAWILLRGANESEFNGWFQVTTWVSTSAITVTMRSPATVATATGSNIRAQTQSRWNDRNVVEVANQYSGNRLRYIANAGIVGQRTDEILARLYEDVINNPMGRPQYGVVCAGVNDCLQAIANETIIQNLENIVTSLQFSGIIPVLCTLPPVSTTYAGYSTAIRAQFLYVNSWIRQYCERNNVRMVDLYAAWVSPTDANGNYATSFSPDGLHPSARAVQSLAIGIPVTDGTGFGNIIQQWAPPNPLLAISAADIYGTDSSLPQLNDYPLFVGTGGATGGTVTGSVATGYTLTEAGSASVVASLVARDDGFGFDQVFVVTSTAASDDGHIQLSTSISSRTAIGDRIKLQVSLSITDITALSRLDVWLEPTVSGVAGYFVYGTTNSSTTNWSLNGNDLVIETPDFVVPSPGLSALNFNIRAQFSGAGGATVRIGRLWLGKIIA